MRVVVVLLVWTGLVWSNNQTKSPSLLPFSEIEGMVFESSQEDLFGQHSTRKASETCSNACRSVVCPQCCNSRSCTRCVEKGCNYPCSEWSSSNGCAIASLSDPLFTWQWWLENRGQFGGTPGVDIAAAGAWKDGFTGKDVVISVVGDIHPWHPDLETKYHQDISFESEIHKSAARTRGTSRASIALGANNTVCGIGVAPDSFLSVAEVQTSEFLKDSSAEVTKSLLLNPGLNDVVLLPKMDTNGYINCGSACDAILEGIQIGRGEKGNVYVSPSGDNSRKKWECNRNAIASSPFTITVGATDHFGNVARFSEGCASLAVAAPGTNMATAGPLSSSKEVCSYDLEGTDLAASVISGMAASLLQAFPHFAWHDVLSLFIEAAEIPEVAEESGKWETNGVGMKVSYSHGFGVPRLTSLLQEAKDWIPRGRFHQWTAGTFPSDSEIPDNSGPLTLQEKIIFVPAQCKLLYTEVNLNFTHPSPGDLEINLISPMGTKSRLHSPRGTYLAPNFPQQIEDGSFFALEASFSICEKQCSSPQNFGGFDLTFPAFEPPFGPRFQDLPEKTLITTSISNCCDRASCALNQFLTMNDPYILVIKPGLCDYATQVNTAKNLGAVGAIVLKDLSSFNPTNSKSLLIPSIMLDPENGDEVYRSVVRRDAFAKVKTTLQAIKFPAFMNPEGFPFTTLRNYGEDCGGTWTIEINDQALFHTGTLHSWTLKLHWADSPSIAPTPTPTPPPSPTPTPTPTPFPSPSPSPPAPSPSPTPTPPSPTPTPTPMPSPTPTPTSVPTPTPTPTLTPTPTPTSIPSPSPVPSPSPGFLVEDFLPAW
eukprot:CAMPEP_0201480974 /NCGR_PEP_ID=MMETSP0151_2-20130828/5322_1 /ASSEMBLY_ACC=CAM_ASM_000257 /TAXON_ID=200890 /ORGANISM="Paramoeba atlantica, Strain 621/1 / CCAP 1560/9" /LENGTH=822 /DNA_ID=CAMNT_0047862977 /DNA_START=18 /DNA_END=2483 /DNA_ORIENTATION=-